MDEKNTEEITQVYLYPHTYISFNALNNKYFKNSDFLRIKSVFELQYLDDPLFDDGSVNTEVLRHLVYGNERDLPILKSMFSYLHERYADFFEDYSYLRNIDTWQLPGAERIQKYFSFFMNDAKREVYYKNAVLAGYLDILQHPSVEAQTYEQVQSYMQELQSISPQAYKEMKDLLSSLYVISGNTQGMSDVAVKSRISKLYAQVFGIKSYHEDLAFFLLNTMYYGYDFQGETDFFSPFSQFLRQYMVEEGMIDSDGQFVRQDFSASGVYDYFSNYLQELLIANISFNSEDITALLYVLSRYIILDEQLYTGEDEKRKITGIQVHLDILKKIQSEMLSFYFLSAR
ncbi:MAG: hypothetical protein H6767_08820 [Candidatus Peribacteria bacterium]|nr:MAG: hypothetical protein H6767_08820 [Candidatus Peribacteria bacterium]